MAEKSAEDWFSWYWFQPDTLQQVFVWENGWVLYLLIALLLFWVMQWLITRYSGQKLAVALPKTEMHSSPVAWLRLLPPLFFTLFMAMLIIAWARPQVTNVKVDQYSEGIDIMLVLDISESMKIEDFKPNRLEAAKQVANDFIDGRFQDRIGIVIFSGEAYSLSPLTTDYELLKGFISDIDFTDIQESGTAIGSALAVGTNRMRESESKSKVMILMSDGDNNAGNIDPITAAKVADAYGIKIYTIGIGREGDVPMGRTIWGTARMVQNRLDETNLRQIAEIGDGQFYRVSNNKALEEVFSRIDTLEKAEIKETRFQDTTDYYRAYLYWALVFFLIWLLTKSTFLTNALQD